jgi:hypothetical protein
LPDHADLLANVVRWAVADRMPLEVHGPGLIDCHLYRQARHVILHLVNLSNEAAWRAPMEELIPVGPIQVKVKLPEDVSGTAIQYLVSGTKTPLRVEKSWVTFEVKSIADHEVVVIS